jgi:HEAT repeat protein
MAPPAQASPPPVSPPRLEGSATRAAAAPPSAGTTDGVGDEILRLLADPDPFVRVSAVAAMRGRMESEPTLIRTMQDRYPIVRREVVRALRTTGSPRATETLIKVAAHDPSAEVREEAVAALGALLREGKPGTSAR